MLAGRFVTATVTCPARLQIYPVKLTQDAIMVSVNIDAVTMAKHARRL